MLQKKREKKLDLPELCLLSCLLFSQECKKVILVCKNTSQDRPVWGVYLGTEIFETVKICGWLWAAECHLIEEIPDNLRWLWHFKLLIVADQFGRMSAIWRPYSEFQKVLRVYPKGNSQSEGTLEYCGLLQVHANSCLFTRRRAGEGAPISLPWVEGKVRFSRSLCKAEVPRHLLLWTLWIEIGTIKGRKHSYNSMMSVREASKIVYLRE